MKKFLLTMAVVLLPVMSFAQPNFSGTWVRDSAKSDVVPNTMYWLTRGVDAGGGRGRNTQLVLEIQQAAGRIDIADPARNPRTAWPDGKRAACRPTPACRRRPSLRKSGETLTCRPRPFGGMPGNSALSVTETWSVSPDGKVT
jgi:hypothetical protein